MAARIKHPVKILVLCTGNSCRSQMAEAYLRQFAGKAAEVYSAGIEAHGLNPLTVSVLREDQVDTSSLTSKTMDAFLHKRFDYVLTVCDNAKESCPVFPGAAIRIHENFPDPARATGQEQQILDEFRRVRDLIKEYCREFVDHYIRENK